MKFAIPEISWHNRDPVLSADFQPKADANEPLRLATGGTDSHVLIWHISTTDSGSVNLEVAADLTRHQKAVNVVRWSPNGQYLASGDDESIIFVWKQKTEKEPPPIGDQLEEQYKETWVIYKTLRGHMEDVLDISWSPDSLQLASGSVDNKVLVWDLVRGRYTCMLTDHKGFVQGVSWDPKGQLIATACTDRTLRTFDIASKKVWSRSRAAVLPLPLGGAHAHAQAQAHALQGARVRLYRDDTLQTYFRRLQFSRDSAALLLAVPAGRAEPDRPKPELKPFDAVYIYTRYSLKVPACVVPCGEPALVVRWSPRLYALRRAGPAPAFPLAALPTLPTLPTRMVLAIGTKRSVLIYDTQQKTPIALVSNIHYTRLTDLTWSPDGRILVASSTDGYCSVITFAEGELGDPLPDDVSADQPVASVPMEIEVQSLETKEKSEVTKETKPAGTMDSFIKFKSPSERSPKKQKIEPQQKTPIKIDVLEDVAMPSWSDNSNNEIIKPKPIEKDEIMVIEDSEDMKLVYEETQGPKSANQSPDSPKNIQDSKTNECTPKNKSLKTTLDSTKNCPKTSTSEVNEHNFFNQAKVTDIMESVAAKPVPSPKAPRRVNFVTLSSPKNSKKKC